jgi:phospholipid N-methyltransferase
LRAFLRDPVAIGAVAPSGPQLAALEVEAAEILPHHVVVELGAGTGPMTQALVDRHPQLDFLSLEPDPALVATLRARFPQVRVHDRLAQDLPELLQGWGRGPVDRVVSSLPWAIWSPALQREVLDAVVGVMHPEGRMVSFTYWHTALLPAAHRFRQLLGSRFAKVHASRVAWANLPPAYVLIADGPRAPTAGPGDTGR